MGDFPRHGDHFVRVVSDFFFISCEFYRLHSVIFWTSGDFSWLFWIGANCLPLSDTFLPWWRLFLTQRRFLQAQHNLFLDQRPLIPVRMQLFLSRRWPFLTKISDFSNFSFEFRKLSSFMRITIQKQAFQATKESDSIRGVVLYINNNSKHHPAHPINPPRAYNSPSSKSIRQDQEKYPTNKHLRSLRYRFISLTDTTRDFVAQNCKQYLFVVNIVGWLVRLMLMLLLFLFFCGCNREKLFTCYAILCG